MTQLLTMQSTSQKRRMPVLGAFFALVFSLVAASTTVQPAMAVTYATSSTDYANRVIDLTNVERQKAGLRPFTRYSCLMNTAQKHSQTMFNQKKLFHGDLRALMQTCSLNRVGENVAYGYGTPEKTVAAWMASSGHRANILNPNFNRIGVGWVANGSWATQQFGN